jgi:hypothetical protein
MLELVPVNGRAINPATVGSSAKAAVNIIVEAAGQA